MLCLGLFAVPAFAQRSRPPERYVQGKPDQAAGKRLLEEFRANTGILGYYDFQLHILPRRGDERIIDGKLWAARRDGSQFWRLELASAPKERYLIQSGAEPRIWKSTGENVEIVTKPVVALAGTELTAFDLQMPFLFWNDFVYEGLARLGGRPAAQFILYPPADVAPQLGGITGVRIYLDSQFKALVQSELIGEGGKTLKTWTIVELKKVGDVYIPKAIEVRNEVTRDKARFAITGVAVGRQFPSEVFSPASLTGDAPTPSASEITRIE